MALKMAALMFMVRSSLVIQGALAAVQHGLYQVLPMDQAFHDDAGNVDHHQQHHEIG